MQRLRSISRQIAALSSSASGSSKPPPAAAAAATTAAVEAEYDGAFFPLPSDDPVVLQTVGSVGHVVLNRPKALNALNRDMVRIIYPTLRKWFRSEDVHCVIIRGVGMKSFCAGGDVRSLYDEKLNSNDKDWELRNSFFQEEYRLNYLISQFKKRKPYVAILDGITMGGGVGLSVHGPFRVATERSLFSMPETALGLFPDVGGTHFLPRLKPKIGPNKLGMYLALTGARLSGPELYFAGIATHYIHSSKLKTLIERIHEDESPERALQELHEEVQPSANSIFVEHRDLIDDCFSRPAVEEIMEALKTKQSKFAADTHAGLAKMSPLSLKVTFRGINLGGLKTIEECFQMEARMVHAFMKDHDFYEGVRAILVDKDRNPKWEPSNLFGVTEDRVQKFFDPSSFTLDLETK